MSCCLSHQGIDEMNRTSDLKTVITYHSEGRIGYFKLTGTKELEDARTAWLKFKNCIEQDHLEKLLILDTTFDKLTVLNILELEQLLLAIEFPRSTKVAIVAVNISPENMNFFGETVARNRGWPFISVFKSEEAARSWLFKNQP